MAILRGVKVISPQRYICGGMIGKHETRTKRIATHTKNAHTDTPREKKKTRVCVREKNFKAPVGLSCLLALFVSAKHT